MAYIVANRSFNNLEEAQCYCNTCDFDYDMIITESNENLNEDNNIEAIIIESKKQGRPQTVNTAKELNKIIKADKRQINNWVKSGVDRSLIFSYIEDSKKACNKYENSNKTTRSIYNTYLQWLRKIDKQLFPEFN